MRHVRYVTLGLLGFYMGGIIEGAVMSDVGQGAPAWTVAIMVGDINDALAMTGDECYWDEHPLICSDAGQ